MEKFEGNAKDIGYAVILLTGDDVAATRADFDSDSSKVKPRARQNVILELGYFYGLIGRNNVAALYESGVERPSDIDGLVYISLKDDSWKLKLAKEMKDAGLPIDMNRL